MIENPVHKSMSQLDRHLVKINAGQCCVGEQAECWGGGEFDRDILHEV
jgi:hypothetical protein